MSYATGNVFRTPDTACSQTSDLNCPHCNSKLEQLGYLEGPQLPGQREWVGENMYRCRECPASKNRFMMMGSGLRSMTGKADEAAGPPSPTEAAA